MRGKRHFCVEIHADACKGCGRCTTACPKRLLAMGERRNAMGTPFAVVRAAAACIGCGSCYDVCPEPDAVTIRENGGEDVHGNDGADAAQRQ